ncbi:MAG: hypothetical protein ACRD6X_06660 [Pyrinomonadaceae bacterium]
MAEEITDNQFKSDMLDFKTEMMRFVEIASMKFEGIAADLRTNSFRFDKLEAKIDHLDKTINQIDTKINNAENKLELVSGRQIDVIPRVIEIQKTVNSSLEVQNAQVAKIAEMWNRLDAIKKNLESFDDRQTRFDQELEKLNSAVGSLVDDVRSGLDLRKRIYEIDQKIARIEEKLAV